jgi:hypothetical protein
MVLTEQRFTRSEKSVWETGFAALVQSLGYGDAIYEQARQHWEARE